MSRRQAAIGAIAATILVLGANANSLDRAPAPSLAMQESVPAFRERLASAVVRACGGTAVPDATTFTALEACSGSALGEALDVFGEIAARLKQL